ncbi:hypothetical protein [Specibacter sp. NPDC078692]|uniref:hypothetical protein n=1 Tax=Specibacter sp. NPDC078692 TaxID=3155818 RepID=UPI00343AF15D
MNASVNIPNDEQGLDSDHVETERDSAARHGIASAETAAVTVGGHAVPWRLLFPIPLVPLSNDSSNGAQPNIAGVGCHES